MKFSDMISAAAASGKPVTLKGHAKITLTDVLTGEQEVHEEDNIITNAVASILSQNFSGVADFSRILPLKKCYSGCLLFQNEIQATADNYNIPSETTNPCKANAGTEAAATQSDTRGNPNAAESEETDTSLKQVWDWPTSAGNGTIRTVCLVPGDTLGNMGTKPIDATKNCWSTLTKQTSDNAVPYIETYDRSAALRFPISMDENGQTGTAIYWSGTTFEEIKIRKDLTAFGILRGQQGVSEISSRTATVRSFSVNKSNIFEDENYYYLYEAIYDDQASKYGLKIDKVSKTDMTVTQADIYYEGITLYTGDNNWRINGFRNSVPRWAYDGKYLYFPNSSGNGFSAVNPNDNTDKLSIDGTVSLYINDMNVPEGSMTARPIPLSEGVIYGENYLINGSTVYQIKMVTPVYTSSEFYARNSILNTIRRGAAVWAYPWKKYSNWQDGQGPVFLSYFLSTIMVLQSPVQKGPTQTMKLEYTLTEIAPQS